MTMFKYISKMIGDKRRWREYKARTRELPADYRTAAEALERYLMYFGRLDGAGAILMFEDLADLFEQSVANGTPVREIFGDDPEEFVETFVANYPAGQWITRERDRFIGAIDRAAGDDAAGKDTGKGR